MTGGPGRTELLERLSLKEYEARALATLLATGRTTAPDLTAASDVPKARIYEVLESLADRGYVEVIPGRPKEFRPKPPGEILDRATENRRQSYEEYRQRVESLRPEFLEEFEPLYERAEADHEGAAELLHVVDVGEPSERETRRLYDDAEWSVSVISNSFAYLDAVERSLVDAVDRGVDVSVLFLSPHRLPDEKAAVQDDVVDRLAETAPDVDYRFSDEPLPWRGTFVDPSMDYDSGEAIFLVEEPEVPDHRRRAAITENGSFVAGMKRYFDLVWDHESAAERPVD